MHSLKDLIQRIQRQRSASAENGSDFNDHILHKKMAKERRRIEKDWQVSGLERVARTGFKRRAKDIVRRRYKSKQSFQETSLEQRVLLLRTKRPSILLDFLYPQRNHKNGWLEMPRRDPTRETVIKLRDFSLLENPKGTMDGLRRIAEAEATVLEAKIDFEDTYCLDVTPFMLLMECWGQMLPVFEGGKMERPMQKVLVALGIPQAMGISVNAVTDFDNVWAFPLCRRRGAGSTKSKAPFTDVQTREIANDEFCISLDEWLNEVGMELTDKGVSWIKNILGELLENAERHSDGDRMDGTWSVSGCMVRREDQATGEWKLQVYIGIANLGDTFSQTLDRAGQEVQQKLAAYVKDMRKIGAVQSDETLRTLAALQDTVTCVADADEADRGGYGLQEMIELVNALGGTQDSQRKPRITIVSGSSCIQLRDPYIRGQRVGGEHEPRLLWCNEENSRHRAPDQGYVYDLDTVLPGTAISIGFSLDEDYYSRIREQGGDDGHSQS